MITGEDTVLLAFGEVSSGVERFLANLSAKWPDMRVRIQGKDGEWDEPFRSWGTGPAALPAESGWILAARDSEMLALWDEEGYSLDQSGEGPLAIEYRRIDRKSLKVLAIEDPYSRSGFKFTPYEVTLVGKTFYAVTVVTPDIKSSFAKYILKGVAESLSLNSS